MRVNLDGDVTKSYRMNRQFDIYRIPDETYSLIKRIS